jgi:hypothetical protein
MPPKALSDRLISRLDDMGDDELAAVIERALAVKADRGDNSARHCAAVFAGQRLGAAAPIDDSAMLAEIETLVATGRGPAAVSIVAARHAGTSAEVGTIARRLRRKRAEKKNGQRGPPQPVTR